METIADSFWIAQPNRDGWWEWMEGGDCRPELLLLVNAGRSVAYDYEWEESTGYSPEHLWFSENYWEGTDTTQKMMPGLWRYVGTEREGGRRTERNS